MNILPLALSIALLLMSSFASAQSFEPCPTRGLKLSGAFFATQTSLTDSSGEYRGAIGGMGELELSRISQNRMVTYGISLGVIGTGTEEFTTGLTGRPYAGSFLGRVGLDAGVRMTQYGEQFFGDWTVREISFAPRLTWHGDILEIFVEPFGGAFWRQEHIPYDIDPDSGIHHTPEDVGIVYRQNGWGGGALIGISYLFGWN